MSPYSQHFIQASAVFEDTRGRANRVTADLPQAGLATVRDTANWVFPGLSSDASGACVNDGTPNGVSCVGACVRPQPPGSCTALLGGFVAQLGAGDDSVVANGFSAAVLDGGPGKDNISAGTTAHAWILSRGDGAIDTITCGPGHDIVFADPDDVVTNPTACED